LFIIIRKVRKPLSNSLIVEKFYMNLKKLFTSVFPREHGLNVASSVVYHCTAFLLDVIGALQVFNSGCPS